MSKRTYLCLILQLKDLNCRTHCHRMTCKPTISMVRKKIKCCYKERCKYWLKMPTLYCLKLEGHTRANTSIRFLCSYTKSFCCWSLLETEIGAQWGLVRLSTTILTSLWKRFAHGFPFLGNFRISGQYFDKFWKLTRYTSVLTLTRTVLLADGH